MNLSASSLAVVLATMGQSAAFDTDAALEAACQQHEYSEAQSAVIRQADQAQLRTAVGLAVAHKTHSTVKAYSDFRNV